MLFTLAVQLVIMRRFEKMLGWFRIIIIYTVCGMAANVFSGIFLPYYITVYTRLNIAHMSFTPRLNAHKITTIKLHGLSRVK